MSIKEISMQDLRGLNQNDGLILQGCGGELTEWVEGINKLLTDEMILLEGSQFEDSYVFKNGELTCMLFPFGDQKVDMGRFMVWKMVTANQLGSMWLSDYIDINLGAEQGPEQTDKPDCPLIGADSNIFNLMGVASRTLKQHGMQEQSKEMLERVQQSGNYAEALNIIGEYVNITSVDDEIEEVEEGVMMQQ